MLAGARQSIESAVIDNAAPMVQQQRGWWYGKSFFRRRLPNGNLFSFPTVRGVLEL